MALDPLEREAVASNVLSVVRETFVHRRMKTALHGIDVVPLLDSLRRRAAQLPDDKFHAELRRIINGLRDRHTRYSYVSSAPSSRLPFLVERAFVSGAPAYFVTKSNHSNIKPGSIVERWNGAPVELVVREFSEDIGASNDAARRALAVRFLTDRRSDRFDPPDEQIVTLDLQLPDGTTSVVAVPWDSYSFMPAALSLPAALLTGQGVDIDLLHSNRQLFVTFSKTFKKSLSTTYPNVEARSVQHDGKDYGYLRIFDFGVDDADDFAGFVASKVKSLPKDGLIIDLRGNPGGYIKAGELLLQLFTSQRISPAGFRFRASDAIGHMLATSDLFDAWQTTVLQGARLAEEHSGTFPIEDDETTFNKIGQVYFGSTLLVVDALTFSTADIFTAGFLDHQIGPVICTDENISAGGANNWQFSLLRALLPGFLIPATAEPELTAGTAGPITISAFASVGKTITASATIAPVPNWPYGDLWEIVENGLIYRIGKTPEFREELAVFYPGDNRFAGDLPAGVGLGFSIRQAIRRRDAQGLVLEDEGITADHYYRMSAKDVLSANEDLITFACGLFP